MNEAQCPDHTPNDRTTWFFWGPDPPEVGEVQSFLSVAGITEESILYLSQVAQIDPETVLDELLCASDLEGAAKLLILRPEATYDDSLLDD